jgi:hypothetical protein
MQLALAADLGNGRTRRKGVGTYYIPKKLTENINTVLMYVLDKTEYKSETHLEKKYIQAAGKQKKTRNSVRGLPTDADAEKLNTKEESSYLGRPRRDRNAQLKN